MRVQTSYTRENEDPASIDAKHLEEIEGFLTAYRAPEDASPDGRGGERVCVGLKAFSRIKGGQWYEGDVEIMVAHVRVVQERARSAIDRVIDERDAVADLDSRRHYGVLIRELEGRISRVDKLIEDFRAGLEEAVGEALGRGASPR